MISSFYPVVAGRVSDGLSRNRSLYQIQTDQISLQNLQQQISTGYRFQTVSESPNAAIRVMDLQREQEFKQQAQVNLRNAQSYLTTTEGALSEVQNIANEVRGIAVEGVGNIATGSERDGLVSQLNSYLSRLVTLGNQRSRDRYLFTGGEVGQVPIDLKNSVVRFQGDDLDLLSIGDHQNYLTHNVTSQRAFGVVSSAVSGQVDLDPAVSGSTRLADLNQGFGIGSGAIQISNGTDSVTLDLSTAETLDDVRSAFRNASLDGRVLNASLTANGMQVQYDDGGTGTIRITNVGSGKVASNLGIATTESNPTLPIVGKDLQPILRTTHRLADLNGGFGLDVSGGLKIIQGDRNYDIDFTGAETVEDVLNAINSSGAAVIADLSPDGRGFRIRSTESGTDFSIAENTGDLATRLGLKTFHSDVLLSDLNHGRGLELTEGNDLIFQRSDGTEFGVDLNSASTIQDIIDLVNNHPDNQVSDTKITLELLPQANGLQLRAAVPAPSVNPLDPPPLPITVRSAGGGSAAIGLGLVPKGSSTATASVSDDGTNYLVVGTDVNPQETQGLYNSVIRLRDAVKNNDAAEIERVSALLDLDLDRISLTRGDLGVRQQRNDSLINANEDQMNELKSRESDERDVDLAGLLSELSSRQAAYEANLRLLAQVNRNTIFDYI
jgi:flagellar hook-associated protein 3 FlgL